MRRTVVAQFPTRRSADTAHDELMQRGISRDDISVAGHGRAAGGGLRADDDHVAKGEGAGEGVTGLL